MANNTNSNNSKEKYEYDGRRNKGWVKERDKVAFGFAQPTELRNETAKVLTQQ